MSKETDKILRKFDEYISWINELPEDTPKDHYVSILNNIRFDLENELDNQFRK